MRSKLSIFRVPTLNVACFISTLHCESREESPPLSMSRSVLKNPALQQWGSHRARDKKSYMLRSSRVNTGN